MFDEVDIVPAILFIFVGIGVLLIVYSSIVAGAYETLLSLNDKNTISGRYGRDEDVVYVNEKAETVMELYWTTVTCIYLILSFVTFHWESTWVIWPIAAIVHKIMNITLAKEED